MCIPQPNPKFPHISICMNLYIKLINVKKERFESNKDTVNKDVLFQALSISTY